MIQPNLIFNTLNSIAFVGFLSIGIIVLTAIFLALMFEG